MGWEDRAVDEGLGMVFSGCKVRVREETGKTLKLAGQSA